MKGLFESLDDLKFDKRMSRWNLRQKILTPSDLERHIQSLEDISHLKGEAPQKEGDQTLSSQKGEA